MSLFTGLVPSIIEGAWLKPIVLFVSGRVACVCVVALLLGPEVGGVWWSLIPLKDWHFFFLQQLASLLQNPPDKNAGKVLVCSTRA
jgi:hypothetical protein